MYMLWHDHVSHQRKPIFRTYLVKCPHDEIPSPRRTQQRPAFVAAERDEMQIIASGDAPEILRHEEKNRPPFEHRKG
jgi:hypothetical protein